MSTADIIASIRHEDIVITRKTRVSDGPNSTWSEETLSAQTFGIYYGRASHSMKQRSASEGGASMEYDLMLLCEADADIIAACDEDPHQAHDEFELGDRTYRVLFVRDYTDFSTLPMKQAGCVAR